jgi:hypothetical protein
LTPLDKNEYTAEKMCVGLLVTYDKYYAIIPEHKMVNNFNNSTEIILKEQTSYYKIPLTLRRFLEIEGEIYPLIEIYK